MAIKMKVTECYGKIFWPLHRLLVKRHLHKRCINCAMSEACVSLDKSSGLCQICNSKSHASATDPQKLNQLLKKLDVDLQELLKNHELKGSDDYDALVLFSGGKDSAFLVSELKRRHPRLRLLAILIDNGFMSPIALDNAAKAAEKLNIDYLAYRPAKAFYKKYFRAACIDPALKQRGCFETIDKTELYFFYSIAKTYAARNNIPLIIDGLAWAQVERFYEVQNFEAPLNLEMRIVEKDIGSFLLGIKEASDQQYFWHPEKFKPEQDPRLIHPFYVWRYEENEIRKEVTKLGLIKKGNDSPLLTNQQVIVMMVIVDYIRIGYCSYEPDITAQIREGTADRRYWQAIFEMSEYIAKTGWMMKKDIVTIAASLDLTTNDLGLEW